MLLVDVVLLCMLIYVFVFGFYDGCIIVVVLFGGCWFGVYILVVRLLVSMFCEIICCCDLLV